MQVQKSPITVGNRGVGDMWVDGGAVRAEGGVLHPQLVIPVTIAMNPRGVATQLAVTRLKVGISTSEHAQPNTFICPPVTESLIDGFHVCSLPYARDHTVDMRFFLTHLEVAVLEGQRQAHPSNPFMLHLRVDAEVAGLVTHNEVQPGEVAQPGPWDIQHGMYSQVLPFWSVQVHPVRFTIEGSRWVRDVLPGLGHDRLRLLEMTLPPPLPGHAGAAAEWDKASRAFDERRYGDCVAECRDLLAMWEKQLGATRAKPIATVLAERSKWPAEDRRRVFVDGLWKAANDLVNVPHHPEGHATPQAFGPEDARLMLLLAAALSEFVSSH